MSIPLVPMPAVSLGRLQSPLEVAADPGLQSRSDILPRPIPDLLQNLTSKTEHQRLASLGLRESPRPKVEELLVVQVRHGAPVGTLDVVCDDLEVGLCVDGGATAQQQRACELRGVSLLGLSTDPHVAVKDAFGGRIGRDLFVQLVHHGPRVVQQHFAVQVVALPLPHEVEALQRGVRLRPLLEDNDVVPRQSASEADLRLAITGLLRLLHHCGLQVQALPMLVLEDGVREPRAFREPHLRRGAGQVGPAAALPCPHELLQQRHSGLRAHHHEQPGGGDGTGLGRRGGRALGHVHDVHGVGQLHPLRDDAAQGVGAQRRVELREELA
mmetsp:Transcript_10650/g.20091  ORF Transcript_10650/g.20091 Transcript_10650/m.20091 type:complete len:327 (-) Transcript_10650:854-1834(-)